MSILSIDYGPRNLGLAVSDFRQITKPLFTTSIADFFEKTFLSTFEIYKFSRILVGKITKPVLIPDFELFLIKLAEESEKIDKNIQIFVVDEIFSTWNARAAKFTDKKRKKYDTNALAAEAILKKYLSK